MFSRIKDFFEIIYLEHSADAPESELSDVQGQYLFNTNLHLYTQTSGRIYSFILQRLKSGKPIAEIHFTTIPGVSGISLSAAPFGGLQVYEKGCDAGIADLLNTVDSWAMENKFSSLIIKCAPDIYDPNGLAECSDAYLKHGFSVLSGQRNLHIGVSAKSFESSIHTSERRRLRKCRKARLNAREIVAPDMAALYQFVLENRAKQGYPVLYTKGLLQRLLETFPNEVKVFGVFREKELISMSFTIRVSPNVVYNFFPVDNPDYHFLSPMVMLMEKVYNYCLESDVPILDLGISVDEKGHVKPGLINFKEKLGGLSSMKWIYIKKMPRD